MRNLPDGNVELTAEGEAPVIARDGQAASGRARRLIRRAHVYTARVRRLTWRARVHTAGVIGASVVH